MLGVLTIKAFSRFANRYKAFSPSYSLSSGMRRTHGKIENAKSTERKILRTACRKFFRAIFFAFASAFQRGKDTKIMRRKYFHLVNKYSFLLAIFVIIKDFSNFLALSRSRLFWNAFACAHWIKCVCFLFQVILLCFLRIQRKTTTIRNNT